MPSNTVTEAQRRAYGDALELLVNRPDTLATQLFRIERFTGARKDFEQASGVVLQPKTGRAQEVPVSELEMRVRWIFKEGYWARDWLDHFDKIKMLGDPTSAFTQAFGIACEVKMLQVAVAGALGSAWAGNKSNIEVPLPDSQKIANGATAFTLDKLQDAVERLRTRGQMRPGARPQVLWTSLQERGFINTTEVKSSDFNNTKVMVNGELTQFYGCDFHRIDDWFDPVKKIRQRILPKTDANIRSVIVYDKEGACLALPESEDKMTMGMIDWDKDRFSWQIGAMVDCGGSRLQDYKVVQVDCTEAADAAL